MNQIDPNYINIHLDELPPYANKGDVVSIDTEIWGIPEDQLHLPIGKFASMQVTSNGKDVYIIFDEHKIPAVLERIDKGTWSFHNAIFDLRQMRRFANIPDRKALWDSMLVEQVMYRGYYSSFGLKDLAVRYLDLYLPKQARKAFSVEQQYTDDMIFYAACDVISQYEITKQQREVIDDDDLYIWQTIERPMLWVLLSMQGFYVDANGWKSDALENEMTAYQIKQELPFNPNSWVQVKKYFFQNYEIELESTDEEHMLEVAEQHSEILEAKKILQYRQATKFSSTYGTNWLDLYLQEDGRAYLPFNQIGTETGRLSSPFQTIPKEANFRKRLQAAPGKILAIADYSTQEPRVYAYRAQEQKLIDFFVQDRDLYIGMGKEILGVDFGKKDPLRKLMKDVWLGISYDMSKVGLSKKIGKTQKEAQDLLDKLHKAFPDAYKYNNTIGKETRYVTTNLGRKIWLNPFSYQCRRNAINGPIQGSSADMSKIAAIRLVEELGFNPLVHLVHDELVAEFDDTKLGRQQAELMGKIMVEVAEQIHPGVPGKIELGIGNSWSDKA